ncbi:hypothetical protein ACFYTV_33415 [Streptomyces sp. NPDC004562]|uniref:hypothetical protein n=1 Tax=Streptomyces sp. NPDC004562 TaxID=3364703 RepID=UPI00368F461F
MADSKNEREAPMWEGSALQQAVHTLWRDSGKPPGHALQHRKKDGRVTTIGADTARKIIKGEAPVRETSLLGFVHGCYLHADRDWSEETLREWRGRWRAWQSGTESAVEEEPAAVDAAGVAASPERSRSFRRATLITAGITGATLVIAGTVYYGLTPTAYAPPAGWETRRASSTAEHVNVSLAVPSSYQSRRVLDLDGRPEAHYVSPDKRFKIKVRAGTADIGETTTELAQESINWYEQGGRDKNGKNPTVSSASPAGETQRLTIDGKDAAAVTVRYSPTTSDAHEQVTNLYVTDDKGNYYRVQVWAKDTKDNAEAQHLYAEVQSSLDIHNF